MFSCRTREFNRTTFCQDWEDRLPGDLCSRPRQWKVIQLAAPLMDCGGWCDSLEKNNIKKKKNFLTRFEWKKLWSTMRFGGDYSNYIIRSHVDYRRKFGSQTSDNMDRWSRRGGKSQGRERTRRKKIKAREKVEKSRSAIFPLFCGSEARKVGSLKRWVRSHLARWEIKNWTPLWRKAHFEVKMNKVRQVGIEISKKCTPLWCKAHFEVKMKKARQLLSTGRNWDVEKVHAVVAQSTFRSQNEQSTSASEHW